MMYVFFFFKQKTAYELRISDWSSDVCSSDLRKATFRRWFTLRSDTLARPPPKGRASTSRHLRSRAVRIAVRSPPHSRSRQSTRNDDQRGPSRDEIGRAHV